MTLNRLTHVHRLVARCDLPSLVEMLTLLVEESQTLHGMALLGERGTPEAALLVVVAELSLGNFSLTRPMNCVCEGDRFRLYARLCGVECWLFFWL